MEQTPTRKLTAKQQAFVAAYLGPARYSGARAARLAGYGAAKQRAYKLRRVPWVRAALDAGVEAHLAQIRAGRRW